MVRIYVRIIPTKTEVKKDDRNTVTERNDSHRKTIVLLKRNVNFLLTGTVSAKQLCHKVVRLQRATVLQRKRARLPILETFSCSA